MKLNFERIDAPINSNYIKSVNVRRKTCAGANLRYENIVFAADADAD